MKTMLVLALVATFIAGASATFAIQDNMAFADKPAPTSVYYISSPFTNLAAGQSMGTFLSCNPGDNAIGGGFNSGTHHWWQQKMLLRSVYQLIGIG